LGADIAGEINNTNTWRLIGQKYQCFIVEVVIHEAVGIALGGDASPWPNLLLGPTDGSGLVKTAPSS